MPGVRKLMTDSIGLVRRGAYKLLVGPLRYGRGADYDAARYWSDRFERNRFALRGPGHEGMSEKDNERMYAEAGAVFKELCRQLGIGGSDQDVLEIGCGTGFFTAALRELGVETYLGIDITAVLFDELRRRHPAFRFERCDVTVEELNKEDHDLVVMIDVIEHIVTEAKFRFAMDSIRDTLRPGGRLIISPIEPRSRKRLFYIRSWSLDDVTSHFPGWTRETLVPFRNAQLVVLHRPAGVA